MVIGINIIGWSEDFDNWNGFYLTETLSQLAVQFPADHFLLLTDRSLTAKKQLPSNVKQLSVRPVAKNLFRLRYWLDFCIPKVLKKHKVDLFISVRYCSLRTSIPQWLMVDELSFLHFPKELKAFDRLVFKQTWVKQLQIAQQLFSASAFIQQELTEIADAVANKTSILPMAPSPSFKKINDIATNQRLLERSLVKNRFTAGKEYFICLGADTERSNVIGVLKAFSLFKKRQQTGFNLLVVLTDKDSFDRVKKKVATYKYREDVVLLLSEEINNWAALVDAAYASIHPAIYESASPEVLNSLAVQTPCIIGKETAMQEIAQNAGLYFESGDIQDLASKMMLLYKDETLRNQLIDNGKLRMNQFSQEKTTDAIATAIKSSFHK
jgi:glycosyltransferase involved in cell wall biosynthesis